MDESKRELVAAWLTKAKNDLASARKRAEYDQAQEAAEKLLAAVLDSLPPAVHPGLPPVPC